MADRATAAAWVRDVAAAELDAELFAAGGFKRRVDGLVYTRSGPDGKQRIHLDLLVRPRYALDAFHLVLRASIAFPEMARTGVAMLGANALGFGKGGTVHIAVLDQITRNPAMLLFRTEAELAGLILDIRRHLTARVIPYLDDRDSMVKLTSAMWRGWDDHAWKSDVGRRPVVIAAGQLVSGDKDAALKTLECYPEGSGERARYSSAFAVAACRSGPRDVGR